MTVRELLSLIWRGRWIVVASVVVALVAGVIYVKARTQTYQSSAVVELQGLQIDGASNGATTVTAPPALDDPEALFSTTPVTSAAAHILHVSDPGSLSGQVTAGLDPTGTQLTITSSSGNPLHASQVANAFADAFLLAVHSTVQDSVNSIQAQIGSLSSNINQLQQNERNGDPSAAAELTAASTELTNLYGQKTALEVEGPTFAQVLHRAPIPSASAGLSAKKVGLLAGLVGLIAGCGIALARGQLDTRLRSRPELEEVAGFPILAELPLDKQSRLAKGKMDPPGPALGEALRELRTTLQVALEDKPCPVVLVTSPSPGDGKTMVVANLAVAWASSGRRVVVVSGDLRRPEVENTLGISMNGVGLTDLAALDRRDSDSTDPWPLSPGAKDESSRNDQEARPLPDRSAVAGALVPTDVVGLAVLPCGGPASNPSELLGSPAMHAVMDRLVGLADLVILDTPPVLAVADAAELARQVDGVVLVASEGKTSREEVEQAMTRLNAVRAHVLGVVLNRVRRAPTTA
ncbi:MAG TPA: Wzz/FepE/Etk N-terminal domain-containing protein, partial [Acidimicrobiales bacterium]|nr:Wzz/FepE/Etk N-terminal domain-containing protein [Acidimicrobiales bacterium]